VVDPIRHSKQTDRSTTLQLGALEGTDWKISTEWGGLFYLVNAALALELYGDFTRPERPSLPLVLWDFLLLLGRELIGRGLEEDPCWAALATLSGRTADEQPGARFEPPVEWRLSGSWLAAFPERIGWLGFFEEGRLRLEHPAGFSVLNVRCCREEFTATFQRECLGLGLAPEAVCFEQETPDREPGALMDAEIDSSVATDSSVQNRSLARWFRLLAQYLEARLCRALGEPNRERMRELVFQRQAELRINSECLTVHFSLADHPIALRIAGLDRDPGWVPAAGRIITFHYA